MDGYYFPSVVFVYTVITNAESVVIWCRACCASFVRHRHTIQYAIYHTIQIGVMPYGVCHRCCGFYRSFTLVGDLINCVYTLILCVSIIPLSSRKIHLLKQLHHQTIRVKLLWYGSSLPEEAVIQEELL